MYRVPNVGAAGRRFDLLANALGQSPDASTDTLLSGASPFPHLTEFSFQDQVGCQASSALLLIYTTQVGKQGAVHCF
jgi:hypothetical protein